MVFSAHLTVLRLLSFSMSYNFRTLISPWVQCTKTTNRVFSSFDRFAAYYNCMSQNFKNLIYPSVKCTNIRNGVLSSNDRFTATYICMSKNFRCHISLSSVHKYYKSCSQLVWPFYGLLQLNEVKVKKSHLSISSVSQIVFWTHLKVWRPSTKVWGKTSTISYLREFSAQVS